VEAISVLSSLLLQVLCGNPPFFAMSSEFATEQSDKMLISSFIKRFTVLNCSAYALPDCHATLAMTKNTHVMSLECKTRLESIVSIPPLLRGARSAALSSPLRHCEERSDEAIHHILLSCTAFASYRIV
jgi:hypothetical protein